MSPSTDWVGGLAPFVLAAVLMAFALLGGRLAPSLRRRVSIIGGGIVAVAVAGFGGLLVIRGLAQHNPAVWARGLAMVLLILVCLSVLVVRARWRTREHEEGL
ncbi:MAG: hypothetical protein JWM33_2712 [Caulobacteraceae bacterium]|nr:hypothetical protein [Caulobacteraceae bacterium]